MAIARRVETLTWVVALGSALLSASCGKSASSPSATATGGTGATGATDGGETPDAAAPTGCPTSALTIAFKPMYSAYIPNSTHTFQIPAEVTGIDTTTATVDWSASDPTMVDLVTDPTNGQVMITTKNSGTVSIIANVSANGGTLCGSSLLTITAATDQEWSDGNMRYNNGVVINRIPRNNPGAGGAAMVVDGGPQDAECTNCHGPTATNLMYQTVEHTPEQTGGFSDDDLTKIFQDGVFPIGNGTATAPQGFDLSITTYATWQSFHKWDVGDTPQSMVVYLRSLTPAAQTGTSSFGMGFGGGMGFMGGGGRGGGRGGAGGGFNRGGGGGMGGGSPAGGGVSGGGATGSGGVTSGGASSGGSTSAAGTGAGGTGGDGTSGSGGTGGA